MAEKTLLRVTYDFVFKYIFGSEQNKNVLKAFLSDHLTFSENDELSEITIKNPFTLAEFKNDKVCVLDLNVETKHGKLIDVEVQVDLLPSLARRIVVYQSKAITNQLGAGDDYRRVKPVILIMILAENMFPDNIYHHKFIDYDPDHKCKFSVEELTAKHILELQKLPKEDDGSREWAWGKFFTTENEEVLNMLAENNLVMEQAVASLKHVSRDEQMRRAAEAHEKFLMDQRAAIRANAENEKKLIEQAKLLLASEEERKKQARLIAEIEIARQEQAEQLVKAEEIIAKAEKEKQEQAEQLAKAEEIIAKTEREKQAEAERFAELYKRIAELESMKSNKG